MSEPLWMRGCVNAVIVSMRPSLCVHAVTARGCVDAAFLVMRVSLPLLLLLAS